MAGQGRYEAVPDASPDASLRNVSADQIRTMAVKAGADAIR
jgi:hypothetical protein